MKNALTLKNVSKSYGKVDAVQNISADIPEGCIYGFLGPNGAGKTSLIRMIMNIISPDSGEISIMGGNSSRAAASLIGYMPEERGLYRKMTIKDLLYFIGGIKGMKNDDVKTQTKKWLEKVELADKLNSKLEEFSKGMQQKIQFIVAVINNPPIMILDEPFSGLDPINLDLLKNLIIDFRNEGKTIVISTHIMDQAEKMCDYLMMISRGQKILDGTFSSIQAKYPADSVIVDIESDDKILEQMKQVKAVTLEGRKFIVSIEENSDPQDILKELVSRTRVNSFEVKKPSLHEIFVKMVKNYEDF